jgi:methyl-accepting chemotaxis protein
MKGAGMEMEMEPAPQAAPIQLGTVILGMNLKSIYQQRARSRSFGIVAMAAMAVLLFAGLWYLVRTVTQPLVKMAELARRVGKGDLSVEIPVQTQDELGQLARTMNEMIAGIREQIKRGQVLVENISEAVSTLTAATDQIFQISAQQATGATEQAATVQETASTSKEIAATASRISDGAQEVTNIARRTSAAAEEGRSYLKNATAGMELISDRVNTVSQRILELGEQSQQIGGVIDIINEISEQTNMLALNAAIEAVGAGEAGKRFSVVAAEVRRLANRTLEATKVVSEMIENIQHLTNTTVMLNEEEIKAVESGVGAVNQLGESFGHILEMVDSTTRAASEITLSTQQQSTASEQMVTSVMEVNEVAASVEKGAKDIESAMAELKSLADRLRRTLVEEGV